MDRKRESSVLDSAAQIDRFKETARALGCDEDEAAFDEKLKAISEASRKPAAGERPVRQKLSRADRQKG